MSVKRGALLVGLALLGAGLMILWGLAVAQEPSTAGPQRVPDGRQGTALNVLTSSEHYSACLAGCDVLLVDDDWDFDSPNGGGRPYYTETLDYLGCDYDVRETDALSTPTAADMTPYSVTIWFTGYDWQAPIITPTEEMELIAYLDGGGSVFASAQEQAFAFPDSRLMAEYFWVDKVTLDVVVTHTVGNTADPLFAGLGPYTMTRPDGWDVYWLRGLGGQDEGPYDDEVSVKPGGFEPMQYSPSGNPNSTRYQGDNFRTLYLGWPFEWIGPLEDRAAILGAALDWLCSSAAPPKVYLPLVLRNN